MSNIELVMSCFLVGLMGSGHCIGMCGGIANSLGFALPSSLRTAGYLVFYQSIYNLGRISSYTLMGAVVGGMGATLVHHAGTPALLFLRILSATMIVLLGLYLMGIGRILQRLEKVGKTLWQALQPLMKKILPVDHPMKAFLLGMLWGWLPCGLIYSTLTVALSSGATVSGALAMFAFGIGTMPAMLLTGSSLSIMQQWLKQAIVRKAIGLIMIAFGLLAFSHLLLATTHATCHHHHNLGQPH